MYTQVTETDFINAFRAIRPDNFSTEGLRALFNYFEELEQDLGESIELDVIAICCYHSEDTAQDIADSYGIDLSECDDDAEIDQEVYRYLEEQGVLVGIVPNGFVYQQF